MLSEEDKGEAREGEAHRMYHLHGASPSATLNGFNNKNNN